MSGRRRTPQLSVAAIVRVAGAEIDLKRAAGLFETLKVLGVALTGELNEEKELVR